MKLRKQLKDLNSQLEEAIDKTKLVRKPVKAAKEIDHEEVAAKMAGNINHVYLILYLSFINTFIGILTQRSNFPIAVINLCIILTFNSICG